MIQASTRALITPGVKLGQGGEGSVYQVGSDALKLYHDPLPPEKQDKLRVMTDLARRHPHLTQVSSWPHDLALDGAQVRGVLMPLISGAQPLHELTTPISRRRLFPHADLPFLVQVAAHLAQATHAIHAAGQVIGDFNPNNVLVHQDGRVTLVDTDSFQITSGARVFPCHVGMPEYMSPAHQAGAAPTPESDVFALLIHTFALLYGGWHPFTGRWQAADLTLAEAIAARAFPYAPQPSRPVQPPPGQDDLSILTPRLADVFVEAFAEARVPSALNVLNLLRSLEDQLTTDHCGHPHVRGQTCPSCARAEREAHARTLAPSGSLAWAAQSLEQLQRTLDVLPDFTPLTLPPVLPRTALGRATARLSGRPALARFLPGAAPVLILGGGLLGGGGQDLLSLPSQETLTGAAAALLLVTLTGAAYQWLTRPDTSHHSYVARQAYDATNERLRHLKRQHDAAQALLRRAERDTHAVPQAQRYRVGQHQALARTLHRDATLIQKDLDTTLRQVNAMLATLPELSR